MMSQLLLKEARTRFLKFGTCKHEEQFRVTSQPLGTNVTLTNCGVCNKSYDRTYNSTT